MPTPLGHCAPLRLPPECEPALLERFLKAEAMALRAVRAAQCQDVPPNVQAFLRRHERDEQDHLRQFESLVGQTALGHERLPTVPCQWPALAVQLYGYEALGLAYAKLLATLADEEAHVGFFEREVRRIVDGGGVAADQAKVSARSWWRKLPRTLDRYLDGAALMPFRGHLRRRILSDLQHRLTDTGLLDPTAEYL
jgi:hypothetical protein